MGPRRSLMHLASMLVRFLGPPLCCHPLLFRLLKVIVPASIAKLLSTFPGAVATLTRSLSPAMRARSSSGCRTSSLGAGTDRTTSSASAWRLPSSSVAAVCTRT